MALNQFLLACLLIALSARSSSSSKCIPAQRDALLRIQSPIKGFFWNVSEDCCSWNKVACDKSGNVILLNLDGYTDDKTLLPNSSIFELLFLQNLTLGNDDHGPPIINGSIPSQIGKLTELRKLTVYGYRGPIPSSIGSLTKLRELSLTNGGLTGNIPDSIGNLRRLSSLYLTLNSLSGRLPEKFRSLTNLVNLGIDYNKVTGDLPSFMFDFPNLESLSVSNNRLQGSLPRNIRPDSKLKYLFLNANNFTGIVPAWLFTRRLETVWIQSNSFSGPMEPFRMPRVSYVTNVDLSNNRIEGIPTSLFRLKNVTDLSLAGNKLSGALDFDLVRGMERLASLSLSGNEGLTLKSSSNGGVRYPPLLSVISIDHCGLTEFPNFLGGVHSLLRLEVNDNKMKGGIDFTRGWKNLWDLNASFNSLGGPLMAASPALSRFNVSHNMFTGKIPANYCRQMELDLSDNKITGCSQFKEQCKNNLILFC